MKDSQHEVKLLFALLCPKNIDLPRESQFIRSIQSNFPPCSTQHPNQENIHSEALFYMVGYSYNISHEVLSRELCLEDNHLTLNYD